MLLIKSPTLIEVIDFFEIKSCEITNDKIIMNYSYNDMYPDKFEVTHWELLNYILKLKEQKPSIRSEEQTIKKLEYIIGRLVKYLFTDIEEQLGKVILENIKTDCDKLFNFLNKAL